ncbi:MAG: UvrD-helicase domain-containing protein [Prevotella sp.]
MLTVYNASAGAGKTFRLTVEYIKHLIVSPMRYESILAVTFTNKATEEMKMRILSQLYGIAHGLRASRVYLRIILDELNAMNSASPFTSSAIDEAFVRQRAAEALRRLLHDYSFFRVETIDSFFQSVLRNLARELDLTPNLRVELADKEIEHEAVDRWIEGLKENDRQLAWIIDYIQATMDDGKAWNIIGRIKTFGEQILTDNYKQHSESIAASLDDKGYDRFIHELRTIISAADKTYRDIMRGISKAFEDNGIQASDLKGGTRGIYGLVQKMGTMGILDIDLSLKTLANATDPDDLRADNWVKKTSPAPLRQVCAETLRPMLTKGMETIRTERAMAATARETLRYLSRLRMFGAIKAEIDSSNREQNRFLLSDTQMLLKRMINSSDAPFIYEKTGTHVKNIMIDEFQDTSSTQWDNFRILLDDSQAHGYHNLIVGDVKQSIYRWRSGDWRLLNAIDTFFKPGTVCSVPLNMNRRSSVNVIRFNNEFFTAAAKTMISSLAENASPEETASLTKAYSATAQDCPPGKEPGGTVSVSLHPADGYADAALTFVMDNITRLITSGVSPDNIAVLVRNNREIPLIVRHAMPLLAASGDDRLRSVTFLSDEAYQLDSSPAVNIIIDALRLLDNPADPIVRARLSVAWQRHVLGAGAPVPHLLADAVLPEGFASNMESLRAMPLYQLCEEIYRLFGLSSLDGQSAYICCLFDVLTEYISRHVADIPSFIAAYDDTLCQKKTEDNGGHGIRIMSIHKSKGLEFGHVILPFCNWRFTSPQAPATLWCKPPCAPFDTLPVIPLEYSKSGMCGTLYERYYHEERLQVHVDNLNLLYVAFTRARDGLYVMSETGQGTEQRGWLIEAVMPAVSQALRMETPLTPCADGMSLPDAPSGGEHAVTYTMSPPQTAVGVPPAASGNKPDNTEEETGSPNPFTMPSKPYHVHVVPGSHAPVFRESNDSRDFFDTLSEPAAGGGAPHSAPRNRLLVGQAVHTVLSRIETAADIERAVRQCVMEGTLPVSLIQPSQIISLLHEAMAVPPVSRWFSPGWRLYNECTILEHDKQTGQTREHRPDRVMVSDSDTIVVDFKLSRLKPEHHAQVAGYMSLLREMGHTGVRGYLWSVMTGEVVEVR